MKKSKLAKTVIRHLNKPVLDAATSRAILAIIRDPASGHEPVYAWLVTNYEEVEQLRDVATGLTWEGIAMLLAEDGVIGSRGQRPNANSVRRVWTRVVRDKERRDARRAAREAAEAQAPSAPTQRSRSRE